jgi:chromosome segregation ATPase
MDILDNNDSYSKLQSSMDNHYSKILNSGELVNKGELHSKLDEHKRSVDDHKKQLEEHKKVVDDLRMSLSSRVNEQQSQLENCGANIQKMNEDHNRKIEDLKQAIRNTSNDGGKYEQLKRELDDNKRNDEQVKKLVEDAQRQFQETRKNLDENSANDNNTRVVLHEAFGKIKELKEIYTNNTNLQSKFEEHIKNYEENKKITDERIEKLLKLFLSLNK